MLHVFKLSCFPIFLISEDKEYSSTTFPLRGVFRFLQEKIEDITGELISQCMKLVSHTGEGYVTVVDSGFLRVEDDIYMFVQTNKPTAFIPKHNIRYEHSFEMSRPIGVSYKGTENPEKIKRCMITGVDCMFTIKYKESFENVQKMYNNYKTYEYSLDKFLSDSELCRLLGL